MCSDNVLLCSQYRPRLGDVGQSDGRSSSNEAGETAKILFTSTVFNFSGAKIGSRSYFLLTILLQKVLDLQQSDLNRQTVINIAGHFSRSDSLSDTRHSV